MSGRIKIYLKNWDSPWRWNVVMRLNCWIIKSHTITFAGILNSTNQGKSLSSFLLLHVYEAQKGNRKAHHLKNFSLMHLWSLSIYILFGKNQRSRSCLFIIFPSAIYVCRRAWDFCFSVVLLCVLSFCLILTTKIISLYSCGCPCIYFHWQIQCQLWRGN